MLDIIPDPDFDSIEGSLSIPAHQVREWRACEAWGAVVARSMRLHCRRQARLLARMAASGASLDDLERLCGMSRAALESLITQGNAQKARR